MRISNAKGDFLEIEIKIPVNELCSAKNVVRYLTKLIGDPNDEIVQIDLYFSSPMKDFHESDEALRIRRIISKETDERFELTYKGAKTGSKMKIREEITVDLPNFKEMKGILENLGFSPAFEVQKTRVNWNYKSTTVSFDSVKDLGAFIEVELLSSGFSADIQSAKKQLKEIIKSLFPNWSGIEERKSYLELLLERRD